MAEFKHLPDKLHVVNCDPGHLEHLSREQIEMLHAFKGELEGNLRRLYEDMKRDSSRPFQPAKLDETIVDWLRRIAE